MSAAKKKKKFILSSVYLLETMCHPHTDDSVWNIISVAKANIWNCLKKKEEKKKRNTLDYLHKHQNTFSFLQEKYFIIFRNLGIH